MTWLELLKQLGIFSIAATLILGAVTLIVQKVIALSFDKKVEAYKAELQRLNHEHNVAFNKIHIERCDVLKELYKRLIKSERSIHDYVRLLTFSNDIPKSERKKKALLDWNDFLSYFHENEILLSDSSVEVINNYADKVYDAIIDYTVWDDDTLHDNAEKNKSLYAAYQKLKDNEYLTLSTNIRKTFKEELTQINGR